MICTLSFGFSSSEASLLPATSWPGSPVSVADVESATGGNISGLVGVSAEQVWAVRDSPSELLSLAKTNEVWAVGSSRALRNLGGRGAPDAEGVTVSPFETSAVYVAAERDNSVANVSRNSILRYDITGSGAVTPTAEWRLDRVLPETSPNGGVEAVAWVPDIVAAALPTAANSMEEPRMVFAVGIEADGNIRLVELRGNGDVILVGTVSSGLPAVMSLEWDADGNALWAACDDSCGTKMAVLRVRSGAFTAGRVIEPPAGASGLNHEGLAFVGACGDATRRALWSDDSATDGHALRTASFRCDVSLAATGNGAPTTKTKTTTKSKSKSRPSTKKRSG